MRLRRSESSPPRSTRRVRQIEDGDAKSTEDFHRRARDFAAASSRPLKIVRAAADEAARRVAAERRRGGWIAEMIAAETRGRR